MSKSNTLETAILQLLFNGTAIANLADNAAASPVTSLYVSLHTADPGEAGTQLTSECTYTGYARIAVARNGGGWTITGNTANPAANIDFAQCTAGTNTVTHFGIGTLSTGAGVLLYKGAVTPNIAVSNGVIPRLSTATAITED